MSQVPAPFPAPASSGLMLPSFLALYPLLLLCSGCLLPVLQLCSVGLCSVLLSLFSASTALARGAPLVHPLLLCSPGSTSVPWFSSSRGCSLSAACPLLGISGNKANLVSHLSHPPPGGAGALLPLALLFNFLFPNQKWPKQRDGEFSTMSLFVFCHGRYKPGKEEHSLTVATFAFSGFLSRI